MEKNQYELCIKVLKKLNDAGVLRGIILIGSWCMFFYKEYFAEKRYLPSIRTRDIDFLVPLPLKVHKKVDIPELLKDLGFVTNLKGSKGYIKLERSELIIEFLVPERGKGTDKPYPLPQLGINAVALRFLDFLIENTISINADGLHLILPHPAAYALHKFIIFKRRRKIDKHDRDIEGALRVFRELIRHKQHSSIKRIFNKMHKKWQEKVFENLKSINEPEIIDILVKK